MMLNRPPLAAFGPPPSLDSLLHLSRSLLPEGHRLRDDDGVLLRRIRDAGLLAMESHASAEAALKAAPYCCLLVGGTEERQQKRKRASENLITAEREHARLLARCGATQQDVLSAWQRRRSKLPQVAAASSSPLSQPPSPPPLSPSPLSASPPFYAKQLDVPLRSSLPIRAHGTVSDAALWVAADRVGRMLRYQSFAVHARLERSEAALHVIGRRQRVSDLPEHSHLRKRRGDYAHEAASDPRRIQRFGIWAEHTPEDGPHSFRLPLIGVENMTVDERTRGLGGLQASVGEENLVHNDLDPRYRGRDVLTHELAHTLMDYGLPKAARRAIEQAYEASVVRNGLWRRPDGSKAYAATNPSEYFAELSMWLFGSHGEWVDRKRQLPAPGAAGLARYDPAGFALVGAIFDGTHTALQGDELEAPPRRIMPVGPSAFTAPLAPEAGAAAADDDEMDVEAEREEEAAVVGESTLHVKNTLRIDVAISWVDTNGDVVPYGKVPAGGIIAQRTYPGHVWEVCLSEHEQSAPVGRVSKVRYRATRHGSQLIEVGEAELTQSAESAADDAVGV